MSMPPQNLRDQNGGNGINYVNQYQMNQKKISNNNGVNQNYQQQYPQSNMTFQDIKNYQSRQIMPQQQNWQQNQGQENYRQNQQFMYQNNDRYDEQQQQPHILLQTPNMQPNAFTQDTGIGQYANYYQQNDQKNGHQSKIDPEVKEIYDLVLQLRNHDKRDEALCELYKKREYQNLAPILWHSFGTISILLQEILGVYPFLNPANLQPNHSTRICNVLCLFQNLALHQETRQHFIKAQLHAYLLPLLNTSDPNNYFENLRVTSLGVVGALVKSDDSSTIKELIKNDIIVYCLKIMKNSKNLQRTVATFIFQRIILDDEGLNHVLQYSERFFAVSKVLCEIINEVIQQEPEKRELRLVRLLLKCCLRLSQESRLKNAMKKDLPPKFLDVQEPLIRDQVVQEWQNDLIAQLNQVDQ